MKMTKVCFFSLILVLMFSVVVSEGIAQLATSEQQLYSPFSVGEGGKMRPELDTNTVGSEDSSPLPSSLSAGLRNLLNSFSADGAVVKMTDKTTKQIRNNEGVLVEIITTINGESISGEVTEEINQEIHQVKADDNISLTVASAQIIKSVVTDDEGNSYNQVQIISPCDANGDGIIDIGADGKPDSQLVVGWTEKDGKKTYFGTIQTDIVYDGDEVASSTNADVSEMTREQAKQLAEEAGLPDLVPYAEGI